VRRPAHLLIVEDDEGIGANLQRALAAESGSVAWARTAAEARVLARERPPDLVLLDLGLPDGDGVDVCRELVAEQPALPIIMLTARDTEIDVVIGLDTGAVDYVTKPFRLAELSARVRAHLRRLHESDERVVVRDLIIDCAARRVTLAGTEIELRAKEFDLLTTLAMAAGTVVRREDLMNDVWDEHWFGSTKTLDVHVSGLRKKLGDDPTEPRYLHTVRGVGFRFAQAAEADGR
jgi:DNA-binding response OmpR family regulator